MSALLKRLVVPLARGYNSSSFASTQRLSSTIVTPDADAPIPLNNPYEKEKTKCILCEMDLYPDYKNVRLLSQFQSPYTGRIYGRHLTGLCKSKQELIEKEIIKAQGAGLMPAYHKSVEFLKDPKLFDPERPNRPHKY